MNTGEFNKFFGAATAALLVFLLAGFFSEELYHLHEPEELAYALEIEEPEGGEAEAEPEVDFASLLQSASASDGEAVFRKCSACHQVEDGANAVGPHLYDVVGRAVDSVAGYDYSGALEQVADVWSFDNLNHFLENPQGWAPGTKMGFAGLAKPEDRAAVIVYLNEIGGTPEPLPEPAAPVAEAAPAEETQVAEAPSDAEGQVTVDATEAGTAEAELAEAVGAQDGAAEGQTASEVSQAMSAANAAVNENETPGATENTMAPETAGATPPPAAAGGARLAQAGASSGQAAAPAQGAAEASDQAQAGGPASAAPQTLAQALAGASPETGGSAFQQNCALCHSLEEGAHGIAPSLHAVIGREVGGVRFYPYSDALAGMDGTWSVARIDQYLAQGADAPGGHGRYRGGLGLAERAAILAHVSAASGGTSPLTPETGETGAASDATASAPAAGVGAAAGEAAAAAEEGAETVADAAGRAGQAVADAAGQAGEAVEETGEQAVAAASDVAEDAAGAVEETLQQAGEAAGDAVAAVEEGAEQVVETVTEGARQAVETVTEGVEEAAEAVSEEAGQAAEAVSEGAGEVADAAEETASQAAAGVAGAASAIVSAPGSEAEDAQAVEPTPAQEMAAAGEAPAGGEAQQAAAPASGGLASDAEFTAALAAASADDGARIWRQCQACHRLDERNGVGPHLGGLMGRPIASLSDYSYSSALQEKASEGVWDWAHLNAWLENPRDWAPGTKMTYRGLDKIEDRAAVVKYINENGGGGAPYP